ncbi:regulatory protein, FmdB family [Desulfarculus baarsii DSM 2075]|uniref:Regulatory protein, FmdB family n=1 Tax=Desulfarculus baarsii (strain ATCC 33931 / DSM 2075 / LMG 7858 / VKM B-1802 / 2st14) TaxID=644282 RepID=E1QJA3_DESB2|nr:zinc ribbon domain-containing protein [Desulfarculus baarsii]ADK85646.1 regulatory protein, FmdB family [Desulfarculus baarsii DSM 2075]
MPIYEFRCEGCGHEFELLSMKSDDALNAQCPVCKSPEISRLISAGSVVVGGGGPAGPAGGVQSRSCGERGSCASITLPGHTR